MKTLKRIGPGSAFKVGALLYAFLGLVLGAIFSLIGLAGTAAIPNMPPGFGMLFGVGAIIILPICYGIFGGIGAALMALFYNLIAGWVGGLEIETT
jgi:hypothetical protein